MMPKVVSFDCADTIIRLGWHPFRAMADCCRHAGIALPEEGHRVYGEMFLSRRPDYERANLTRDTRRLEIFWDDLMKAWLLELGASDHLEPLSAAAAHLAYGPGSPWFQPFDDVLPSLDWLQSEGIRTCVVSNWDLSLDRVLASHNLDGRFELIVASLAEGIEKPNPGLFRIALDKMGVSAEEVLHVGDNPVDDVIGAANAGIPSILIDRCRQNASREERTIASLYDLPEAISWNA